MNLFKLYLTNNDCYKSNVAMTPKGIMVHSTGANNPRISRYVQPLKTDADYAKHIKRLGKNIYSNDWNRSGMGVCVHGFVGKLDDGSIASYQTLPWNMRGWHAGGSANSTHIGFEICEDGLTDATYFNAVYKEAVELCAYLCKLYKLDPLKDGVIIGHYEGAKRGVASNHGDPNNWFPKHKKSMDTLRKDVAALVNSAVTPDPGPTVGVTYRVQVGTYDSKAAADDVATKLKALGYQTTITEIAPESPSPVIDSNLAVGDKVKMASNAVVYGTSRKFSSFVYASTLYVRSIVGSRVVISTLAKGAITGAVDKKYLTKI